MEAKPLQPGRSGGRPGRHPASAATSPRTSVSVVEPSSAAVVGIELGDGEAGQALVPGEHGQAAHGLVKGQALVVQRDIRDRQVEEVDNVDVEVDQEPVGRRAHPRQGLLGCLCGTPTNPLGRQPGKVPADEHLMLGTAMVTLHSPPSSSGIRPSARISPTRPLVSPSTPSTAWRLWGRRRCGSGRQRATGRSP
jgi:hypothetical protein